MTSSATQAPSLLALALALLLAVPVLGAGVAKLARAPFMQDSAEHLGFTWPAYQRIGALEVVGALGVLVGLVVPLLGALAASCLAVLLALATAAHLRRGDRLRAAPAAVLAVLAVVVAVLLVRAQVVGPLPSGA